MAIDCNACGKPVHETVVTCPHCGEATGVPIDPIAEIEVSLLPALPPPPPRGGDPLPFDRVIAPDKPKRPRRPQLPKAIARKKRR